MNRAEDIPIVCLTMRSDLLKRSSQIKLPESKPLSALASDTTIRLCIYF